MSTSDPRAELRRAFPELGAADRARLARRSRARRRAALFATVAAARFDARQLCRRLTLEGWEHLAATGGRGVLVLGAPIGAWRLAALAAALYRGPLEVAGDLASDRLLGVLAGRLGQRLDHRLLVPRAAAEEISGALRDGGTAGLLLAPAAGETVAVPFLGGTVHADTAAARAALDSGAPMVPVFGYPEPRGAYRVVAREPIEAQGDDAERLTRRSWQVLEAEIRRRPEHWPWGSGPSAGRP